ncbi:lipopolysaccharide cholinephosphotransferase [Breznakia blatticola]|uniref:Lipopolysaccharide cholinephosphotransferase n=1 Tax=Breznakia blatticola TaxID=1754012 RepID=A0A4R7ZGX7_9FIRM|nr:LicD family protein [Breznakia blatticola]TDW16937.1 lipopolysaccharide cholinephosphotransferase [Breznakia blatticola]
MKNDNDYVIKIDKSGNEVTVAQVHAVLLEMLKDLDAICKANDIPYYLTGGSCLGAVRHNGFIPWDDDADVGMMYEDYKRFLKVVKTMDQNKYYYQCFDTHKEYNVCIPAMKLRRKNTYVKEVNSLLKNKCSDGDGLFIDVFIVDYVDERRWVDFLCRIKSLLYMVVVTFFENIMKNPLWLKTKYWKFIRRYSAKAKKRGSQTIGYDLSWTFDKPWKPVAYKKADIYPVQYHTFEDTMLPIPKNPDALLEVEIGGVYMEYPKGKMQAPKHIADINLKGDVAE